MKNDFLKKVKIYTPYTLLVLIIVLPWFLKQGHLFFTDMTWGPNMDLPPLTSKWIYLELIVRALSFVIPVSLLEKLFLVSVFTVILWGGNKITQAFTNNDLILFLGSAFALFNPFVYDRFMYGQLGVLLSYGFFLAFFGSLLLSYLKPPNKKQLFLSSVSAGLSILFTSHSSFFIGLVYFIFGILIFTRTWAAKKDLLKIAKYLLLIILIILAINFNWLYGAFFQNPNIGSSLEKGVTEQDLRAFKTAGATPSEAIGNVLLMSGFWGMEQFRYETLKNIKSNWGRSFYFLLPIIIWGLVANLRDKEKRNLNCGLIFLFIVAFVLALGIALPLTSRITLWLFNNIPFYKGLREPQKWVAIMVAVYEALLVLGLIGLFKKKLVIKNKELVTALLTFIILLQAPLMAWGGAGQIRPIEYPQDWYEVNELVVKESGCQSKILFLPWHLYMGFRWVGSVIANPSSNFFQCPVIYGENMEFGGIYSQTLKEEQRKIEAWLFSSGKTGLLEKNEYNIGYIVLAKEVDWQGYLWIENHSNVEFVKETKTLRVYRVHPVK